MIEFFQRMRNYSLYSLVLAGLVCLVSCGDEKQKLSVDQVIQKTIERHGGEKYDNMEVEFDFRKRHFRAKISSGQYVYERT